MGNKAFYTVLSILVAVLGWFGQQAYFKLVDIEKEIVSVKLELVKVQAEMITREEVVSIVHNELVKKAK